MDPWEKSLEEIKLTPDYAFVKQRAKGFNTKHLSDHGSGLIRGMQILKQGENTNKLLVMITDAADSEERTSSMELMQSRYNWCDEIRTYLSTTPSGKAVNLTFVGMPMSSYSFESSPRWFEMCFGKDNIYNSTDLDEFFDTLDELMPESVKQDVGQFVK
ncbi:hypothetical protein M445_05665 [Vibrio owensii 47666-1]|uniref:hypothetical protein n=1 Tax=Vibrio owensii TaxID=696485 RepID=UPI000584B765|nr:hypothetical protein [Vibrio owensii]KIF48822.1 hypothetical protein M445_05665 [Vibrio owensii 47666-1]